jgi:hypothetical protein
LEAFERPLKNLLKPFTRRFKGPEKALKAFSTRSYAVAMQTCTYPLDELVTRTHTAGSAKSLKDLIDWQVSCNQFKLPRLPLALAATPCPYAGSLLHNAQKQAPNVNSHILWTCLDAR